MKVHKHFIWYKLSELIRKSLADFHPKITGLDQSYDQLKFIVNFDRRIILHPEIEFYRITITVKPSVCELITANNFNLFRQHFEDFLRLKLMKISKKARKNQSIIELRWDFTLDSIPGIFE